jgi:hypothetical protein
MEGWIWWVAVVLGPVALAAAMAYGLAHQRRRSRAAMLRRGKQPD